MSELDFNGFFEQVRADREALTNQYKAMLQKAKMESGYSGTDGYSGCSGSSGSYGSSGTSGIAEILSKVNLEKRLKALAKADFTFGQMFGADNDWCRESCPHCETGNLVRMGRHPDYDPEFFICYYCKHCSRIDGAIQTGITKRGVERFTDYEEQKGVDY